MDDEFNMLTTFLGQRDVPCPGCKYNLRGLTGTRCPECDQELALQVGLVEPKIAAFVAGLVGISVGMGGATLLLMGILMSCVKYHKSVKLESDTLWSGMLGFVLSGASMAVWLRSQRWLARRSRVVLWGLAVLGAVVANAYLPWLLIVL